MKIKIGDINLQTFNEICDMPCVNNDNKQCPFYHASGFVCKALKKEYCDEEVEIPDKFFDNREKEEVLGTSVAVTGTCWNSQQGQDGYRLQFETDNKQLYKYMEKAAQTCIDIACANRKD